MCPIYLFFLIGIINSLHLQKNVKKEENLPWLYVQYCYYIIINFILIPQNQLCYNKNNYYA